MKRGNEESLVIPELNDDMWTVICSFIDVYDPVTLLAFITISKRHVMHAKGQLDRLATALIRGDEVIYGSKKLKIKDARGVKHRKRNTLPSLFSSRNQIANQFALNSFQDFLKKCKATGYTTEDASKLLSIYNLSLLYADGCKTISAPQEYNVSFITFEILHPELIAKEES